MPGAATATPRRPLSLDARPDHNDGTVTALVFAGGLSLAAYHGGAFELSHSELSRCTGSQAPPPAQSPPR